LEGVDLVGHARSETVFDVVINSQVRLHHVHEVLDDLVAVLVQQSLQLTHVLEFVEILFELGVQLLEHSEVLVQDLHDLGIVHLTDVAGGLLQLLVLLAQSLVEVGHLGFVVLFEQGQLLADDVIQLAQELNLVLRNELFCVEEYLAHQLGQILEVVLALSDAFGDVLVDVAEVSVVVFKSDQAVGDHLFLYGVQVLSGTAEKLLELV